MFYDILVGPALAGLFVSRRLPSTNFHYIVGVLTSSRILLFRSMQPVIAVFDIGKTNKKLFLLDQDYHTVYEETQRFAEAVDDDGDPCEDINAVVRWFNTSFEEAQRQPYSVTAVNVSAYGATLVHLDEHGYPATPLYNYLKPFPEELATQFYAAYGGQAKFSQRTASPAMGMLNTGLQLYWLKHHKPAHFARLNSTVHLSQYFAYLLHGKLYSGITDIGCHTALWDFERQTYHPWVQQEKMEALLPAVVPATHYEPGALSAQEIKCGIGIHDSSAALVPYLLSNDQPFVLLSTGTWGISLNPFNTAPLTAEELSQDCLQYMSHRGQPVRAARLLMGLEHDHQERRLADHFNKSADYHQRLRPDVAIFNALLEQELLRFYPQTMQHTGPLPNYAGPEADLTLFSHYEEAYHQLMLDLVRWQVLSLQIAKGATNIKKIYVSGGFCRNALFVSLLASFFPATQVLVSELDEASALGAALVLHEEWNAARGFDHVLKTQRALPLPLAHPLVPLTHAT